LKRIASVTWAEFLLLGHVVAAIIWLGAGFLMTLVIFGARAAGDREKEVSEHQGLGWLAPRLFIPSSLATLIFGILLVADGFWTFDQLWIVIGLAGWAVSFVLGFFYFRPEGERIGALVGERGLHDAELDRRLRRVAAVDRVQVLILFLVVADMVLKPTGDDEGVLIGGAAILAAAAAAAALAIRGRHTEGAPAGP
jgi:hypothetical protein